MTTKLGAAVLAGGRSRRMGRPKEALPWGDTTLLGRLLDELHRSTAAPIWVVARDEGQDLPALPAGVERLHDERPGGGPLPAVATALRAAAGRCDAVLVCACDMPFLDATAVAWLHAQLGDASVLMPNADGHLQPLCAIYHTDLLPAAERLLAKGIDTVRDLSRESGARILDETDLAAAPGGLRFLTSVNTTEAYEAALRDAQLGP